MKRKGKTIETASIVYALNNGKLLSKSSFPISDDNRENFPNSKEDQERKTKYSFNNTFDKNSRPVSQRISGFSQFKNEHLNEKHEKINLMKNKGYEQAAEPLFKHIITPSDSFTSLDGENENFCETTSKVFIWISLLVYTCTCICVFNHTNDFEIARN